MYLGDSFLYEGYQMIPKGEGGAPSGREVPGLETSQLE